MPAIGRSPAATSSRRCRQIVPVSRYVVPELLLWRQQRDDVAVGNGVSRQRRDDVAVKPGWLPSREPGSRNLRIIATRALGPSPARRWACARAGAGAGVGGGAGGTRPARVPQDRGIPGGARPRLIGVA